MDPTYIYTTDPDVIQAESSPTTQTRQQRRRQLCLAVLSGVRPQRRLQHRQLHRQQRTQLDG